MPLRRSSLRVLTGLHPAFIVGGGCGFRIALVPRVAHQRLLCTAHPLHASSWQLMLWPLPRCGPLLRHGLQYARLASLLLISFMLAARQRKQQLAQFSQFLIHGCRRPRILSGHFLAIRQQCHG